MASINLLFVCAHNLPYTISHQYEKKIVYFLLYSFSAAFFFLCSCSLPISSVYTKCLCISSPFYSVQSTVSHFSTSFFPRLNTHTHAMCPVFISAALSCWLFIKYLMLPKTCHSIYDEIYSLSNALILCVLTAFFPGISFHFFLSVVLCEKLWWCVIVHHVYFVERSKWNKFLINTVEWE